MLYLYFIQKYFTFKKLHRVSFNIFTFNDILKVTTNDLNPVIKL